MLKCLLAVPVLVACGSAATPNMYLDDVTTDERKAGDEGATDDTALGDDDQHTRAIVRALVAVSEGVEIGYVVSLQPETLTIYAPEHAILFTLNDTTGFVTGRAVWSYGSAECAGTPTQTTGGFSQETCTAIEPARRVVAGLDNDVSGWTEASTLRAPTGARTWLDVQSTRVGSTCYSPDAAPVCGYTTEVYDAIPTAYALPIAIVEAE